MTERELTALDTLEQRAERFFTNKEITKDNFYEYINMASYLSKEELIDCIEYIPYDLRVDKGYLYWDEAVDYLTSIVATYLDGFIRQQAFRWGAVFKEKF